MPSTPFYIVSARALGAATVRVSMSLAPHLGAAGDANSVFNPNNWTLAGSASNYVTEVIQVDGSSTDFDLHTIAQLTAGSWTVSAANLVTADLSTAVDTGTSPFTANTAISPSSVQAGATNDSVVNVIRKFFNPALKGPTWNNVLAALATAPATEWDNAKKAFDQLFLSTASSKYLDKRASDVGLKRPNGVNLSDEDFRKLAVISKTRKLSQEAILEVLEVFYGSSSVRASVTSGAAEPYLLSEGETLSISVDESRAQRPRAGSTVQGLSLTNFPYSSQGFFENPPINITFPRGNFSALGTWPAIEVAAAITRGLKDAGSKAFASAVLDPTTNTTRVCLYSGSLGLTSSVRIVGGSAQTKLRFPTANMTPSGSSPYATWNVQASATTPGNIRFTMTAGTAIDLTLTKIGDLAYIYGSEFTASNCIGTWPVVDISVTYSGATKVQWFEIKNPLGVQQLGVSQTGFYDLAFFQPTKHTIYEEPRHVTVAQSSQGRVDVIIPATSGAVHRKPGTGAYLKLPTAIPVSAMQTLLGSIQVTTSSAHGLQAGDKAFIDGGAATGGIPSAGSSTAGHSGYSLTTEASEMISSESGQFLGNKHAVVPLTSTMAMVIGGINYSNSTTVTSRVSAPSVFEITGRSSDGTTGAQIELYDWNVSASNTFQTGRRAFGASALSAGRVMVTGGTDTATDSGATANTKWEIFQYNTNNRTWAYGNYLSGNLPQAIAAHGQISLLDGRVMICGGWNTATTPLTTGRLFNPTTQAWTVDNSMLSARKNHQLLMLSDGVVLSCGGENSTGQVNICEQYTPAFASSGTWTTLGKMTFARVRAGYIVLPDDRVVAIGGFGLNPIQSSTPAILNSCEIYDRTSRMWSPLPPMKNAREQPVVGYIAAKNWIVVAGGGVTEIEVLDLNKMTRWRVLPQQLATGLFQSAGTVVDGCLLVAGGCNASGASTKKNYVVIPGEDKIRPGGLNRLVTVASILSSTQFTIAVDPSRPGVFTGSTSGVTVTPMKAVSSPATVPGPYIFDPQKGLPLTSKDTILQDNLTAGQTYDLVNVTDASAFPDAAGFVCFGIGRSYQTGPVKYLGKASSTQLLLDGRFRFPIDIPKTATVTLLSGQTPFQPAVGSLPGALYITGSPAGRVAAEATLEETVATGTGVSVQVVFPGDRGLGGQGLPVKGAQKLSDVIRVWGGDSIDQEVSAAKGGS